MKKCMFILLVAFFFALPALAQDLVGYWKFDEGTGTIAFDSSGYGNNGNLLNGPVWIKGKVGSALMFDGIDDNIEIPDSSSLDLTDALTISMWLKPDSAIYSGFPDYYTLLCKWHGIGDQWRTGYLVSLNTYSTGQLRLALGFGNGEWIFPGTVRDTWNAGQWYHIAVTYDRYLSSGNIKFYVDGTLDTLYDENRAIAINTLSLYINIDPYELWYEGNTYFPGVIDEVKLYSRPLSDEEIMEEYLSGNGLVGYWKFDEGADTIAYDSSDYGNDGTLLNGPNWVKSLPLLNEALEFDGADDYVRIDKSEIISSPSYSKAITAMAWVKPDSGSLEKSYRVVTSHWSDLSGTCTFGDPSNAWVMEAHQADGKYHSAIAAGDGTYGSLRSKTSVQEGVWQHLAFTWDDSLIIFYFNGIADTSTTYMGNMVNSACYMEIGKTDQIDYVWKGLEDEVKLYNRALSAEEIKTQFESGFERGDANYDGDLSASDVIYLVNYLFKGGPYPQPLPAGDANCDGEITVSDTIYLINFLFKGGPSPGC
ncbi:MAG: dockerin type I domain-containing protein [candidate division Zixibacteria bacterium]|nr:dockerin type I domain-containing protein [candidate division Zixibacteria bacterium]